MQVAVHTYSSRLQPGVMSLATVLLRMLPERRTSSLHSGLARGTIGAAVAATGVARGGGVGCRVADAETPGGIRNRGCG
jgi:hypothetical protein